MVNSTKLDIISLLTSDDEGVEEVIYISSDNESISVASDDNVSSLSSDEDTNIPDKSFKKSSNLTKNSNLSSKTAGKKFTTSKRDNNSKNSNSQSFKKSRRSKPTLSYNQFKNNRPKITNSTPNYWDECTKSILKNADEYLFYINKFKSASQNNIGLATRLIFPCLPDTTTNNNHIPVTGRYIPALNPTLLSKTEVEKLAKFHKLIFSIVNPKLDLDFFDLNSPYYFVPLTSDGNLNWLHINNIGGVNMINYYNDKLEGLVIINRQSSKASIVSNKRNNLLVEVDIISQTQVKKLIWINYLVFNIEHELLLSAQLFGNFMGRLDSLLLAKELADYLNLNNVDLNKLTDLLNINHQKSYHFQASKYNKIGLSYAHMMIGLQNYHQSPQATPGMLANNVGRLTKSNRYESLAKEFGLKNYISHFTGSFNLSYILLCVIGFVISDLDETMGVKVLSAFKICFSDYSVWESIINKYSIQHGSHEKYNIVGYEFKSFELLQEAVTVGLGDTSTPNYQRMEYLGDLVIDFFTSILVYKKYPLLPVKYLRAIIKYLVRNRTLAVLLQTTDLKKFMPKCFDNTKSVIEDKVVADIFEAVCTAVWLDCCLNFKECFVVLNSLTENGFGLMLQNFIDNASDSVNINYCLNIFKDLGFNKVRLSWSFKVGEVKVDVINEQGKIVFKGMGLDESYALWDMFLRLNKLYADKLL